MPEQVVKKGKLIKGSYIAKWEADKWADISKKLVKSRKYEIQSYVFLSFSSELYLKSLLMYLGINVMNKKIHNLYNLFDELPDYDLKMSIASNVLAKARCFPQEYSEENVLKDFKKYISAISCGFVEYRYIYEKILNKEEINIPTILVKQLNRILRMECETIQFEVLDEKNHKVKDGGPKTVHQ